MNRMMLLAAAVLMAALVFASGALASSPGMVVVGGLCQGAPTKETIAFYVPNAYVRVRNNGTQTGKAYVGVRFRLGKGGRDSTYSTSLAGGGTAVVRIPPGKTRVVHVFASNDWNGAPVLASWGDSCQAKIVGTSHWKSLTLAAPW